MLMKILKLMWCIFNNFPIFSLMHHFLASLAQKRKKLKEIESGLPNWLETLNGKTSLEL